MSQSILFSINVAWFTAKNRYVEMNTFNAIFVQNQLLYEQSGFHFKIYIFYVCFFYVFLCCLFCFCTFFFWNRIIIIIHFGETNLLTFNGGKNKTREKSGKSGIYAEPILVCERLRRIQQEQAIQLIALPVILKHIQRRFVFSLSLFDSLCTVTSSK